MKRLFTFLLITFLGSSLFAQAQLNSNSNAAHIRKPVFAQSSAKLAPGESVKLTPNPVSMDDPSVEITAVNVVIFSYHVYTAGGQIVEIENLSGRPSGSFFRLPDGTAPGIYTVKLDTDSGSIIRKIRVI